MKKSMMKIMSMALVIASVMSISAITVSAKEFNEETYEDRSKSTYTVPSTVPEANYERPPEPKSISDIKFTYLDDGRIIMRQDKYQDYVIDRNLNIAYALFYFDDGDVIKGIDPNFPGYDNMRGYSFSLDKLTPNMYVSDYSEKPDDRQVGDFIVGRGSYVDTVKIISPKTIKGTETINGVVYKVQQYAEREFKSEWIVKKYLGKGGLVTLPEGAEAIAPTVFQNNKTITKIVFPKSFKYVPRDSFLNSNVSHLVFKSSENITLERPNINYKGKTVIEFYTPSKNIRLYTTYGDYGQIEGLVNFKEKNSKSSLVMYSYGDYTKDSWLNKWGFKMIYTKKIAYP